MASGNLSPSENSLTVIVGTKLSRTDAMALKALAVKHKIVVSGLVRSLIVEWIERQQRKATRG